MITEDYVSFEVASLLKDRGFPQKMKNSGYFATEMVYSIAELEDGTHHLCHQYPACYDFDNYICAPTLQIAMKWLREVYNIHIVLSPNKQMGNLYGNIIFTNKNGELQPQPCNFFFGTYEQACEEGIKYCLEKLI